MRSPRFVLALVAGLWGTLAGGAPSAQPAPPPTPDFGERIDVRVVNVEVVVTDRHGLRVSGLRPADFRLKVDGRETPVDYFTEVREGTAVGVSGSDSTGNAIQGLPSVAPGAAVGTSYLVFLDDYFAFGPNRDEALHNLKKDLARLGPDDRMAIVAFDGRKLATLAGWTASRGELEQAIDAALRLPALGLQRRGELAAYQAVRGSGGRGFGGGRTFQGDRGIDRLNTEQLPFARRLAEQVDHSVDAAVATMRGFAPPAGRKVMLLLAGGWPYSPADFVVNRSNRPILEQEVPTGEELLRPLNDTANLLGYTVYPVDVQGLEQEMVGADRHRPPPAGSFSVRPTELRATLQTIAAETGGQPILAGNHESPLAIAAADTRSYYWIGFTPDFKRDDARHRLKVEIDRPGFTVRTRENYLDLSRRGEATLAVESAMLFGNRPGGERLPVELGAPASSGLRQIDVPMTVAIPVAGVSFVPIAGKFVAALELRVAALDKDGHRSDVPAVPFKLTLDRRPDAGKFIPYSTTVRLRKIDQRLTIAIVDSLSNQVLTASTEVKAR